MDPTKVEHYRSLLESRAEALKESVMRELRAQKDEEAAADRSGDAGDEAVRISQADLRARMNANDAARLMEIEEAQVRLARGTYGVCETCGEPIDPERLELIPEARRCAVDQEAHEEQEASAHPTL